MPKLPNCLAVILYLVTTFLGSTGRAPPSNDGPVTNEIDSDLRKLLDLKSAESGNRTFMESLKSIAKKRSWEHELTRWEKITGRWWPDAPRSTSIQSGDSKLFLVLWKSWSRDIPSSDYQIVLLLDSQGRYLDSVGCAVNCRLSRNGRGNLNVVIPPKAEQDGTQLIIRLDGESARGNFGHRIYHGKERLHLYWGENKLPENQPSEWDAKGLCRIAIKDKQFHILFPTNTEKSDKEQK
jgi:hypothetical protein